jgi:hypothetical protein
MVTLSRTSLPFPSLNLCTLPLAGKQVLSWRMGCVEGEGNKGGGGLAAAAMHFLKHSDQRRLEPVRIIKSLAFQLAKR